MSSVIGETSKPQTSASSGPQVTQEYVVKIPKSKSRKFNVMRFSSSLKVDVQKWTQAKMERENNLKEFKAEEDIPKYGAGSEFGREQREESRRKKFGIISKKYNPDDQPWILKLNGKTGRKYKGIREGGVTENASYYVFTQSVNGTFEAYPVAEWYNFTPIQRYKALSAEEAEEEFGRRDKVLNYFSIMVKKRLQKDTVEEEEEESEKQGGKKKKNKKAPKEFKISDMDDWARDSSESEKEDEEEENEDAPKKPQKKGKEKKKDKVEDEGREESDEGDFDDREVDYITGSSSSEAELEDEKANRQLKGVEDEEALRKLDASEDEEEVEENKEPEENQEEKPAEQPKQKKKKEGKGDSSGDSTSDTSDSDFDDTKVHAVFMQKQTKKTGSDNSANSSRANTPTRLNADVKDSHKGMKRKLEASSSSSSKKPRSEGQPSAATLSSLDGINEDAIRRYLSRKPMTASEILHKFKSKKTKLNPDQLVTKIADVLKKMDLVKRNIKGKMYLSLKS